jgi:predicted ATPase/DNA-binding winged helix-turn-helix (wHTH) protein
MSVQVESAVGERLKFGEFELAPVARALWRRGEKIKLGSRALDILIALASRPGQIVSQDDLRHLVWRGALVDETALRVGISAVRKALGDGGDHYIATVPGRGYCFVLDVETGATKPATAPPLRSNLPSAAGPLIGRTAAVNSLRDLMSAFRVVTLTGPGGIGKTALALEVARGLVAEFDDGGWLVELASVSDPSGLPSAVAEVLGLKIGGGVMSSEVVARAIGKKRLLLVLDNCEHMVDDAARLADEIVRRCSQVTVLVTTREALRIDGEHIYRVPPLDIPASDYEEPQQLLKRGAVKLLLARMRSLGADFSVGAADCSAIAAICRRLDGIPLAIEFAAPRAATHGFVQVLSHLDDRLAFLTIGRRTALPKDQTLRATLDWSYQLLPEAEQRLLDLLAVFEGGFTLDGAAAVASEDDQTIIMDGIGNLVAKSLIAQDGSGPSSRWRLLETIRVYALEKLVNSGEAQHAWRRHARYFCDIFAPVGRGSPLRSTRIDFARLVREIDNVRIALDWSFSSLGDKGLGIDLTAAYVSVWLRLGLMAECRERCEQALRTFESDAKPNMHPYMRLQMALGSALLNTLGSSEQSKSALSKALEIADSQADLESQAQMLGTLIPVLSYRGDYGEARTAVKRLGQIGHQLNDPTIVVRGDRLWANTLLTNGRPLEARQCFERVLQSTLPPEHQRRVTWHHSDDRALARASLTSALLLLGFVEKARIEAHASLEDLGPAENQLSVCRVLYFGLSRVALLTGDLATADRAITRLIELATRLNSPLWIYAGRYLQGKLLIERGEFAKGCEVLREVFETSDRTGWRPSYSEFKGALAVGFAGLGQLSEALNAANEAIAGAGRGENGQMWFLPELLRIKGEVLLRQATDRSTSAADDYFILAGELAREQGALFWELRVALSVARLRIAQGRNVEAREILGPVYGRFTEGFSTADLQAARATLEG